MRRPVTVLLLAGVLFAQAPRPRPKGSIHGTVRDTSGAPVAGITVAASANLAAESIGGLIVNMGSVSTETDDRGIFALRDLPAGSYELWAGKRDVVRKITLDADQDLALDLVVPANPTISGHVLNQDKEPVVDAFVWLLKPEYQKGRLTQVVIGPKVTAEDGAYAFDTGLEPNRRYFILVNRQPPDDLKPGEPIEVPTYFPSATSMDSATPVILQPGERRERLDIRVATAPFYCIDGKIQVSGAPSSSSFAIHERGLADTRLALLRSSAGEDGTYHACGLSPGSYRLSTDEGFTDFSIARSDARPVNLSTDRAHLQLQVDWDGDPPPPPDAPKLDDAARATLRKLGAAMGRGDTLSDDDLAKLAGRLGHPEDIEMNNALIQLPRDESTGKELQRVLMLMRPRENSVQVNLSGTGGELGLLASAAIPSSGPLRNRQAFAGDASPPPKGIPAGAYSMEIEASGPSDPYIKEVSYDGRKIADGALQIAPGAGGTLHVLVGRGPASLEIGVREGDDKPVSDATIVLIPDSVTTVAALSRLVKHGQTDQSGTHTFRPLPPGKYRVLATTQAIRWGVPEDLEKLLLVLFQAQEVELNPIDHRQITLAPVPL